MCFDYVTAGIFLPNCPKCQINRILSLLLFSPWDNDCVSDSPFGLALFLLAGPALARATVNLKKKTFWTELSYIVAHIWKKGTTLLLILITLDTQYKVKGNQGHNFRKFSLACRENQRGDFFEIHF